MCSSKYYIEDICPGDLINYNAISPTRVFLSPGRAQENMLFTISSGVDMILIVIATNIIQSSCLNCFIISPCGGAGWIWLMDIEINGIIKYGEGLC